MRKVVLRATTLHKDERGFTLLETLVGMAILSFGLMAVVSMMDWSFNASVVSKHTTKATHLAAWMLDRIKQDSSLTTQIYSTNITSLRSFDNDATPDIVIDTASAADPVAEPGRTAVQEWRALIQGLAVPGFMAQSQLPGDALPQARGVVTIIPYDPNRAGNHTVIVQVNWQSILTRGVRLETVLATAE